MHTDPTNQDHLLSNEESHPWCLNLTPFGELFVWSAAAVGWLRRVHRILGRASYSTEMTARADCSSTNPNRLPVRLSVEEAVVLLSFGIVEGLVCTSPILQSADPTEEQLRTFKAALQKNRSEYLELLHIRRRIEATGYYSNLLEGLSVKQQRESSKRRATQSHSAGGVGPLETTVGQKELSVRQRRKARREKRKRERLVRHISDEAEYLESAEDDDLNDEFSFNEDHAQRLTIDELLESHTSGAREPAPIVPPRNECPPHEDFNSTIPQHLPRSTPEEWLRSGEVNRLYLPTDVRSDGLYRVALWLLRQTSTRKFAKASQSVQSNCHQLMRCRVFADLWAKGFFVTTSTVKMGGDFLVYQGDPLLYHASHVVALCDPDEPISSSLFSARLRIANSVRKLLVLATLPNISGLSEDRPSPDRQLCSRDSVLSATDEIVYCSFRWTNWLSRR